MLKKLMAIVLVGLLTIASMAVMPAMAANFQSQYNLSFEQTTQSDAALLPSGWTVGANLSSDETTNSFAVVSNEQAQEGTYSLKIKHTAIGTVNDRVWRVVTGLTPGAQYVVTGYMYLTGYTNNAGIMVFDGNTGASGANWISGLSGGTGIMNETTQITKAGLNKWIPLTATFTAPANGIVSLAIGAYNSSSTNGTVYFDALDLHELNFEYHYNTSFEQTTQSGTALLPSGWTVGTNLSSDETTNSFAVVSNEQAKEGTYSLKLKHTGVSSANDRVWRVVSDLTPGAQYMVTGYMYLANYMKYAGIFVYDGNTGASGANWASGLTGTTGAIEEVPQIVNGLSNKWLPLSATFTAPANGTVSLAVGAYNSSSTNGTVYFDDLALYKLEDGFDAENNLSFEQIESNFTTFIPTGWNISLSSDETSDKFAVVSDEQARTGNFSLKMKNSSLASVTDRPWKLISGLTPGAAYMVTGYMKVTSPLYYAGINVYGSNDGTGSSWSGLNVSSGILSETNMITLGAGKWLPIITYFIAPDDGAVSLALVASNSASTSGIAYFDDITVTKMADTVGFDVKVLDANFEEVTDLNAGQATTVKLMVNGTNMTASDKNYTLIYATYSKTGDIVEMNTVALSAGTVAAKADAATVPGSINANAGACINSAINITIPAGQTLKVFIFDNMETLNLVSEKVIQ